MRKAACLLAMLVAATAAAQVREQVTVELIEVPVYVFGARLPAPASMRVACSF